LDRAQTTQVKKAAVCYHALASNEQHAQMTPRTADDESIMFRFNEQVSLSISWRVWAML